MCRTLVILALSLAPQTGWGQSLAEQERQFDLLRAHQARLELQLTEQGKRIRRLKGQRPGVGRDYQLSAALRQSQQLADRLTKLRGRLRAAHAALLARYDRAIARAADDAQREALAQRRAKRTLPKQQIRPRIVTNDTASPNDSPEDLEEKADLLKDSEEKVRVQMRRVQQRLTRLEHQARLQRHARAADDSPFVETAPRRTSRARASRETAKTTTTTESPTAPLSGAGGGTSPPAADADGAAGQHSQIPAPPSPGAAPEPAAEAPGDFNATTSTQDSYARGATVPGGSGSWACSGGSCTSPGVTVSVTTRDAMDPSLLEKLGQVGSSGDLRERIAALKKATSELKHLAGKLSSRAKELRQRAKRLQKRK